MRKLWWFILVILAILGLAGCTKKTTETNQGYPAGQLPTVQVSTTQPSNPNQGYPAGGQSGVSVQVVATDNQAKNLSIDELKKLPSAKVSADGKNYEGPKFSEVLKAGGVKQFKYIMVKGANGNLMLLNENINDQVILDISSGNINLIAIPVPKESWIRNIIQLEAESK